ncbi:CRISPR-associated endonuclease Cas2 [Nitratiruptor tergarcus]|uniref:CRISPR-associated endoribonuclease Cas2 n=1 Tax=Nitratiruptor tergarcus DSM 16512 TaxID=1069081 RepID=A0A1W1WSA3_9BACT|nr:CRISPR-associated endonuclease Cas2 [Nitratiruptor tergarcus]SMC09191.1 CRISPR-associated protein Cas2 [Nitratiruptor tergarcus DSM 16512]
MNTLIMYDISCDKKRNKVEKLLSSYGYRVNYSVFEISVPKHQFKKLLQNLIKLTSKEDNVRVYILTKEVLKKSFKLHSNEGIFTDEELYF